MPITEYLQTFLDHVRQLADEDYYGEDGFYREFTELKQQSAELRLDNVNYATTAGQKDENRKKNRYKDILPFEKTRVKLSTLEDVPESDYINANYIKGARGRLAYIASQGPLPNTVDNFWRMLWEKNVEVVVMACREYELGKPKCQRYWAEPDGEAKTFGDILVAVEREDHISSDFVIRILTATRNGESRTVSQYHYNAWPDHGVPTTLTPILDMIALVREAQSHDECPIVVHCSAGCGRTGTICAIDYVWSLLKLGKLEKNFSLFNVVSNMRRQRHAMVQTKEQYELVYLAVEELYTKHLDVINNHTYQNVTFKDREASSTPELYENITIGQDHATLGAETDSVHPSDKVIKKVSEGLIVLEEQGEMPISPTEKNRKSGIPPRKPELGKKPSDLINDNFSQQPVLPGKKNSIKNKSKIETMQPANPKSTPKISPAASKRPFYENVQPGSLEELDELIAGVQKENGEIKENNQKTDLPKVGNLRAEFERKTSLEESSDGKISPIKKSGGGFVKKHSPENTGRDRIMSLDSIKASLEVKPGFVQKRTSDTGVTKVGSGNLHLKKPDEKGDKSKTAIDASKIFQKELASKLGSDHSKETKSTHKAEKLESNEFKTSVEKSLQKETKQKHSKETGPNEEKNVKENVPEATNVRERLAKIMSADQKKDDHKLKPENASKATSVQKELVKELSAEQKKDALKVKPVLKPSSVTEIKQQGSVSVIQIGSNISHFTRANDDISKNMEQVKKTVNEKNRSGKIDMTSSSGSTQLINMSHPKQPFQAMSRDYEDIKFDDDNDTISQPFVASEGDYSYAHPDSMKGPMKQVASQIKANHVTMVSSSQGEPVAPSRRKGRKSKNESDDTSEGIYEVVDKSNDDSVFSIPGSNSKGPGLHRERTFSDDATTPPAVPVKTMEALQDFKFSDQSQNSRQDLVTESATANVTSGTGGMFAKVKTLTAGITDAFKNLAASNQSDAMSPSTNDKKYQKGVGFKTRLDKKPNGPRHRPETWKTF